MPAANAADGRGDLLNRLFKTVWESDDLTGAVIEHGSDIAPKRPVFFSPKVERKSAVTPAKERSRSNLGTLSSWRQ
jgi:hypothetical protein